MSGPEAPNLMNMRRLDLGAAFEFVRNDPQWLKKVFLHGVMNMIPVLGVLCTWGWTRRAYQLARQGQHESLPEIDWGQELSDGIAPFVASLNPSLVLMPLMMLWLIVSVATVAALEAGGPVLADLTPVAMVALQGLMVVGFGFIHAMLPEMLRHGYNGELLPLRHLGRSLRTIWANPGAYALTCVGVLLSNVIGSLGFLLFGFGVFLTLPLGQLMSAHIIAQWDSIVEQHERGSVKVQSPEVARNTQRLHEARVETSR